ncbi:Uncharacterized protein DBV15_06206 [Temnothorax longispinosus]|uniref:Uncharacterized protein n=1 Tax=Temnothorax longispinosus TaxID=300112 RepID=A0A4S2KJQ8_9HYME|nr:Uncharacterized protein DBV15_06206 [Temnothorax longispinosus]
MGTQKGRVDVQQQPPSLLQTPQLPGAAPARPERISTESRGILKAKIHDVNFASGERSRERKCRTQKYKNRTRVVAPHAACGMRPVRGAAHGTSRRSNPPSRASRERPVATLLSTSLRLLPPLSLHPASRLVRIVAYEVAALVGATPSGSASLFTLCNPSTMRPTVCPTVRPSASLSTICVPSHPSQPPRRGRCELVVSKSTILTFRGCSSSRPPSSLPPLWLKTFKLQPCSFHFSPAIAREYEQKREKGGKGFFYYRSSALSLPLPTLMLLLGSSALPRQTNERAGAAARAREEPSPAFAKEPECTSKLVSWGPCV